MCLANYSAFPKRLFDISDPSIVVMAKISASGVVGVLVLLAMVSSSFVVVEAARIETFNAASCDGPPTNTFLLNGNTCQDFNDQGAVRVSEINSDVRVSVHNTEGCQAVSQVGQFFGPTSCSVQGRTALNSVFIA